MAIPICPYTVLTTMCYSIFDLQGDSERLDGWKSANKLQLSNSIALRATVPCIVFCINLSCMPALSTCAPTSDKAFVIQV